MKITAEIHSNIDLEGFKGNIAKAAQQAMSHTVSDIVKDAVNSTAYKTITGTNRRSLVGEVSGTGVVADGGGAEPVHLVDDSNLEGAVYSTSGYGGYLETGTSKMAARPYIKPAVDKHFTIHKFAEKVKGYLK